MKRFPRLLVGFLGLLLLAWIVVAFLLVQPVVVSAGKAKVTADPDALRRDVRRLSAEFHPRDFRHPGNLDRAALAIRDELEKTGAKVHEQTYTVLGKTYRNVVARLGPADGDVLVVGAHYDSCHDTPGADDNASGVAGLLELARMLARHPVNRPIELVAYTLEEPPFFRTKEMGSAIHAADLEKRGVPVRGVIVLEMIGYFSDAWMSQDYPIPLLRLFYPSRGNFVAVVGRMDQRPFTREVKAAMKGTTNLPVWSINAPTGLPGLDFSDHLNYWARDWNAVMVTDTSFYRNKEYHELGDTWDRLDYSRMADVVTGVYRAVQSLPGSPETKSSDPSR